MRTARRKDETDTMVLNVVPKKQRQTTFGRTTRVNMVQLILRTVLAMCFALIVSAPTSWALDPHRMITQYVLQSWGVKKGLPAQTIWGVTQGPKGYLWLATNSGLVRFDGAKFTLFDSSNTPQFSSNNIRSVITAKNGSLWIGTYGGGILRYAHGVFTKYTKKSGLTSNVVYTVFQSKDGAIWAGTAEGVSRIRHGNIKTYSTANGLSNNVVFRIAQTPNGAMWFGTLAGGVNRLLNGHMKHFGKSSGIQQAEIIALYVQHNGKLIVGTYEGGMYEFTGSKFRPYKLPNAMRGNGVDSLLQDNEGNLWIGEYGGGLVREYKGHYSSLDTSRGLTSNYIFDMYIDKTGDLWLATRDGLDELENGDFLVFGKPEGLANPTYDVYQGSKGKIWVGTESHGLFAIKGNSVVTHLTKKNGLPSNNVSSLTGGPDGGLWIGTYGGGISYMGPNGKFKRPPNWPITNGSRYILAILRDRQGAVWVSTEAGLYRYVSGHVTSFGKKQGLPQTYITFIFQDRQGQIWFGSNGAGLLSYKHGRFITYTKRNGLPSDYVYAIYQGPSGALWIGTRGGGLARFDHGKFFAFNKQNGLQRASIFSILRSQNNDLWMSTPRGLLSVSLKSLDEVAEGTKPRVFMHTYGESSGLRSSQFPGGYQPAGWKAKNGSLWFPSTSGIVEVPQHYLPHEHKSLPIYLTGLTENGRAKNFRKLVILQPGTQSLAFHYTAIDFSNAADVKFRYRLVGFDRNWIKAGTRRTAYYEGLAPGRYRFQVEASLYGQNWIPATRTILIRQLPYFYQTWWFYVLVAFSTLGLASLLYRVRVHQLRVTQDRLSQLVAERTARLEEALTQLERLAHSDELTGLANRRALGSALEREWKRSKRNSLPLSVVMFDIDHFKPLNDHDGHQRGDECLKAVASLLAAGARRPADVVGRWGGEEFLLILPDTAVQAAASIADELRISIQTAGLVHDHGGLNGVITISAGVSNADFTRDHGVDELVSRADAALYRAKSAGRNRVETIASTK